MRRLLGVVLIFGFGFGLGRMVEPEPVSAHTLSSKAQSQLDQSWTNNDLWGVPTYTLGQEPTCTSAGEGAIAMIDAVFVSCDGTAWG